MIAQDIEALEALRRLGVNFDREVEPTGVESFTAVLAPDYRISFRVVGETGCWEGVHHHKGVSEQHRVLRGWAAAVGVSTTGREAALNGLELFTTGEHIRLDRQDPHALFFPAGAHLVSIQEGYPLPNLEADGRDWWPDTRLQARWLGFDSEELVLAEAKKYMQ